MIAVPITAGGTGGAVVGRTLWRPNLVPFGERVVTLSRTMTESVTHGPPKTGMIVAGVERLDRTEERLRRYVPVAMAVVVAACLSASMHDTAPTAPPGQSGAPSPQVAAVSSSASVPSPVPALVPAPGPRAGSARPVPVVGRPPAVRGLASGSGPGRFPAAPPGPPPPVAGASSGLFTPAGPLLGTDLATPFRMGSPGCSAGDPALLTGRLPSGRTYRVHLPARYDPRRPYPVILAYHGRSQQAADIEGYSGLDAADAVVLYPQGRRITGPPGSTAWEGTRDIPVDGRDVAFTRELLAVAGRAVCVDPQRVSAVGASQGGGFAAVLACSAPGTVSSIAAVAGAFYRPEDGGIRSCNSGPLRVLEFHGTADPVINYDGTRRSRPIPAWLDEWSARDRCTRLPVSTPIPPDVTEEHWIGCAPGSELLHFRVTHGNHGWPGGGAASVAGDGVRTDTISATAIILRFLAGTPVGPPFRAVGPPAGPRTAPLPLPVPLPTAPLRVRAPGAPPAPGPRVPGLPPVPVRAG